MAPFEVDVITTLKRYSVSIQTDKLIYKRGDNILYRILVLDQDLKPFKFESLKHQMFDGKRNLIVSIVEKPDIERTVLETKVWPDSTEQPTNADELIEKGTGKISEGIYSYFYKVAEEPNFGYWSITVTVDGEDSSEKSNYFNVEEIISPHHDLIITTKPDVKLSDEVILLKVSDNNYFSGERFSGTFRITASVYDPEYTERIYRYVSKQGLVNSHSVVRFHIEHELHIYSSIRPIEIKFDVEFKEASTDRIMTQQVVVRVHKSIDSVISFVQKEWRFKPGFLYNFVVTVETPEGVPIKYPSELLKLKIKYLKKSRRCKVVEANQLESTFEYTLRRNVKNGKVKFTLDDLDDVTRISLTASIFESKSTIDIKRHPGETDEYLVIKKKDVKDDKSGRCGLKYQNYNFFTNIIAAS